MEKLQAIIDDIDTVDEPYREMYVLRDGKYHFDGVTGIKTEADVARVSSALAKQKQATQELKTKYAVFEGRNIDEIVGQLDSIDELKIMADKNAPDEEQINKLVEARINAQTAPLQRKVEQLSQTNEQLKLENEGFIKQSTTQKIHDSVRKARIATKALSEAEDDMLLHAERLFEIVDGEVVTKDGVGVTPGVGPEVWLTDIQPKKALWWPASSGGGANGSGGSGRNSNNPWTLKNWSLTEQGRVFREDRSKAEQMAKSAGTTIGGGKPAA